MAGLGLDDLKFGAFGGGLGLVLLFGQWLMKWVAGRLDKRQAQLDAEHDALDMSWKDYRQLLENDRLELRSRVTKVENQNRALRLSFEHVAGALIRIDPTNDALVIADRLMAAAFPTDFTFATARAGAALDSVERETRP